MGNGATKKDKNKSYLLQTCDDHEGSINCMAISEDESVLATGSDDKTIRLWATKTDKIECIGILEGHTDYITWLIIEENFLLSSSADKTIKKWDMSSCECVLTYSGHTSTVNKLLCTGDFLFSVSYDKTARCWDFDSGECVRVFVGHKSNVASILFIPAERDNMQEAMKFVQKSKQNNTKKPNTQLRPIENKLAHSASKASINLDKFEYPQDDDEENEEEADDLYSKDIIITGSLDSTAKSWSFETGETIYTFKGHTAAVTCLATDQLGKLLFTGSSDHSIRSWDIQKGQLLKIFEGHQTTIINLVAHKKLLYSISSDHTARCWVMEFGDCTRIYKGHTHTVGCIHVDKGLVYTGCGDSQVRCFEAKSASLLRTFKGHTGAINCLKLIDNKLVSGSFDGTLRVWDGSGLSSEQSAQNASTKDIKSLAKSKDTHSNDTVTIENETNYNLRLNSSLNQKSLKPIDKRSDVDSGIDEREFMERNAANYKRPTQIQVKEMM